MFALSNRSFVIEEGGKMQASRVRGADHPGARRGVWLTVQIKALKRKQKKINASKIAFFYLRLFFPIETFQWVIADSNKKIWPPVSGLAQNVLGHNRAFLSPPRAPREKGMHD